MSYKIRFYSRAEKDYLDAFDWYQSCLEGLGERFEESVEKRIKDILNTPLIYPNKSFDCRECKIGDFPYLIVYKVDVRLELVTIVSIYHTSRHPKRKYRK